MTKFRFPLHIHLSTLFIVMTVLISGAIAAIGYRMSYNMLAASAEDLTHRAGREIVGELRALIGPVNTTVEIFAEGPLVHAGTVKERFAQIRAMAVPLQESAGVTSLYIGYENGDFFMLQRVGNDEEREKLKAPPGTNFIVRSIDHEGGHASGRIFYLDENLALLDQEERPSYASGYDPRARDWYREAQQTLATITTQPYVFYTARKVGVTIARRAGNGHAVIGADIPLDTLDAVLARQKITPSSQLALVRGDGMVIANEHLGRLLSVPEKPDAKPALRHIDEFGIAPMRGLAGGIEEARDKGQASRSITLDGTIWQLTVHPLYLKSGDAVYLMAAIPENELFAVALKIRAASITSIVLILLVAIPVIWFVARTISASVRALTGEAEAIRHFDYSSPVKVVSIISEVHTLAETMDLMKGAIRKFMSITHSVAAAEDFEALLAMLLKDTMSVSNAVAGALYLAEEDRLTPSIAYADDGSEVGVGLQPVPLSQMPQLLSDAIARQSALSGELSAGERQGLGLACIDAGGTAAHTVVVPLINRQHQMLGLILLQRETPINPAQLAFAGAISDSASSSLETRGLIREQKALFEAFIQLIAGAIDAKSAYTGGHCTRVPVLTKMLARAACEADTGPYADFSLSDDEWEAVHVAAWLHDCGKVTTPEFVVDKATKLETIYDRIHEIRMRFEVLKRDAEIECLKGIAAGMPQTEAYTRMQAEQARLDDDFAFIAACNEGGESMAPERLERLQSIAARTWIRTLDDRLGVSHEEKTRKEAAALPAVEPLLADKPEHRFERRESEKIRPDNKWGFRMKVPELLYNRGELHNLSVMRGTLTAEDRYKINEHIVQTIIMLSALPFPRHLKNVPEIAGGHHEKMDGTGYPKGLSRDDMSPVARMMAIADIFEALTARDRPYKKGKTLSESIRIMSAMQKDRHIDPELFELFLRSGVYRDYAQHYMMPEQIDAVDVDAALAG
ncbi:MAG: metal-dependent phosphohydrolase [Rhodocyclaceae bacterium]|nr:metal-dependent phosphohydrolase [Rhodocyclaceae bacterium]